jgi:recombination protein RecA
MAKANTPAKAKPTGLVAIINEINQTYGPGSVVRGSEINWENHPRVTSGSFMLDMRLGGGWPINRWAEIYGEFSSGKSTLVLKTIAANQALDPEYTVWWLAAEDFDPVLARMCGCDLSRIYLHETNVMQEGFQKLIDVCETREVDCVVIDSYPALVPAEEDDGDMGDSLPGLGARINGQFWRKQGTATKRSLITDDRPLIGFVINQPREKIGIMFGSNETTPGGRGKNFYYTTRVELRRGDWINVGTKDSPEIVGQEIKATTIKNKSYRPRQSAIWDFYFENVVGEGGELLHTAGSYDLTKEVLDAAIAYDVIHPGGGGYTYQGEFRKGRVNMLAALKEGLLDQVAAEVMMLVTKGRPTEVAAPAKKAAKATKKARGVV